MKNDARFIKHPFVLFLLTFTLINLAPIPVFPCYTRPIIMPIEPYHLSFCTGYLFETIFFGKTLGVSKLLYPSVLAAFIPSVLVAFVLWKMSKSKSNQ